MIGKLAGASYAILKDGKLVAMETMGYQDLEKKVPLTEETIFRVFSQSKPVGTAGFLTLIDEVSKCQPFGKLVSGKAKEEFEIFGWHFSLAPPDKIGSCLLTFITPIIGSYRLRRSRLSIHP